MKQIQDLIVELLWLAAAGVFAFHFWKTFLAIQILALSVTLALRKVERGWR